MDHFNKTPHNSLSLCLSQVFVIISAYKLPIHKEILVMLFVVCIYIILIGVC